MALSHCSLFPGARLPLHIFEPRYREMLADVLDGDRMFCIGTSFGDPDGPGVEIEPYSCAGLLRACVGNEDGTLNLVLEGLHRVRFTGWREGKPYRVAEVEPVISVDDDPEETAVLGVEIKTIAREALTRRGLEPGQVDSLWAGLETDEAVADFVAFHLVQDVETRHPLLGMASVAERMMFLGKLLTASLQ